MANRRREPTGVVVNAGTLDLSGAGTLTGSANGFTVNPGGTLFLDNSTTNTANRLGGKAVNLNGGTFEISALSTTQATETAGGKLTLNSGGSVLIDNSNSGAAGSILKFSSLATTAGSGLNVYNYGATSPNGAINGTVSTTSTRRRAPIPRSRWRARSALPPAS